MKSFMGGSKADNGQFTGSLHRALRNILPLGAVLILTGPSLSQAAIPVFYNWAATNGNWSTPSNWDTNSVPLSDPATVLQFTGGATFTSSNDLPGDFNLYVLNITGFTGYNSTIAATAPGQTLVFPRNGDFTGAIQMDGSGSFNINQNIRTGTPGDRLTIRSGEGQLWIGNSAEAGFSNGQGNINLNGGSLLFEGDGGALSYVAVGSPGGLGGVISNGGLNPGSVVIAGQTDDLSVILFGSNTYTGGTALNQGKLILGNNSALGTGTLTVDAHVDYPAATRSLRAYDTGSLTLGNAINLNANLTLGGGPSLAATITLTGPVQLGGDAAAVELNVVTSAATISGDISGSKGLIKNGDATLTLSGNNSYSGGTTVEQGILKAGSANAFVSGTPGSTYTVNGGTLDLNDYNLSVSSLAGTGGTVDLGTATLSVIQSGTTEYAGTITGGLTGGILAKSGTGTLTLTGTSDYSGGTNLMGGKLLIGNDQSLGTGDVTLGSGTTFGVAASSGGIFLNNNVSITGDVSMEVGSGDFIQFVGNVSLGSATRKITFTTDDSDVCFMGDISGTSGITFAASPGVDTLVMYCGESKTYTGLTKVGTGVRMEIDMDLDAVAIPGDLQVDSGGSIHIFNIGSTLTSIAPTSNVTLNGDMIFISNFEEKQTLASLTGTGTLTNGEDGLPYESLELTVLSGDFSGTLQQDSEAGNLTLVKSGTGTLRLAGANTYGGPTELAGGKLVAANNSAFSTGSVWVTGTSTTLGYEDGIDVANLLSADKSFSVEVSGTAAAKQSGNIIESSDPVIVTKTGTGSLTLSGSNTYSGGTALAAGKLVAGSNDALGTGTVTVTGASTTLGFEDTVTIANEVNLKNDVSLEVISGAAELSGNITESSGSHGLTKIGDGTLTLSGLNTYTGGTNLTAGTLLVLDNDSLGGENGGALVLGNGTTFGVVSGGNVYLDQDVTIAGNVSISGDSDSYLEFDGNVDLGSSTREVTLKGDFSQAAFAGVISGSGGLTVKASPGAGDVALALMGDEANTYTGTTTVGDQATLLLQKNIVSDPSAVAVKGDLVIKDGGQVISFGVGQIANNTKVTVETGGFLGFGTLADTDVQTIGGLYGGGTVAPITFDLTLRVGYGAFTGSLEDLSCGCSTLALEKIGSGTLTLGGINTYTGGTIVRGGTLEITALGLIDHGTSNLIVGQLTGENGIFNIDAYASATNAQGVLGLGVGAQGTANIIGAWNNTSKIRVGNQGTGSLTIQNGGFVSSSTVELGTYATGTGHINVLGVAGNRGTLQTSAIVEKAGSGTITIDGGVLKATANSSGFIKDFEAGDIIIETGGATVDSNGFNITVVSPLVGDGGLSKEGSGILKMAGANTYEGATIVRNGTMEILSGASISHATANMIAGQLSGENGTLLIDAGATVTNLQGVVGLGVGSQGTASVSGTWNNTSKVRVGNEGAGTLTIQNGGLVTSTTVELGTYATGTGSLTVNGIAGSRGVLQTASIVEKAGNGTLTLDGGILRATANSTGFIKDFEAGEVTLAAGGGTIDSNGYNISVISALGGIGSLSKDGLGTLKLSGANTYTGGTFIRKGTLEMVSGSSISHGAQTMFVGQAAGEIGNLQIDAGGSVTNAQGILGSSVGSQGSASVSGTWTNTDKIRVGNEGTGTLTIQNGGLVNSTTVELGTYATGSGAITVQGVTGNRGTLLTGSIAKRAGAGTLALDGGVLKASGDNTGFVKNFAAGEVTLGAGGGFIDSNGYNIAITSGLSGTGALTKDGAGMLKLSGASTYSGGTVMNAGTLLVANATALGTGNLDLNSGALATDGIQHQINIGDDFVWKVGATIALTLTADANSEIVVVAGGIRKAGAGKAIFTLTPSGLPPGHTNFLVMTVAEGFGTLTAGSFGYTSSDPGFVGTFRISGTQLWFDDDYVSSGSLTSSGSLSSSTGSADVTAVPEPSTWMLIGLGMGWMAWMGINRTRRQAAKVRVGRSRLQA